MLGPDQYLFSHHSANFYRNYVYRVFLDVPSDITIEVDGSAFSLHKVRL